MKEFYLDEDGKYVARDNDSHFLGVIEFKNEKEAINFAKKIFKKFKIKTFDDFKKETHEDMLKFTQGFAYKTPAQRRKA